MKATLIQVPGRSTCCGGLLWVPRVRSGETQYWICGTCRQACDRELLAQAAARNNAGQPGRYLYYDV